MPNPYHDPFLSTQPDNTLYWWNGRPCRIVKVLCYGDRPLVQIQMGQGVLRQVPRSELTERPVYNIPANFQQIVQMLRELLMKIGADPHAGDYNVETLLAKLEEMSDALVALNQQNQTVQWGNIQGGISSQADLNFELNQRVARTEFSVLFNQEIARYSQQLFGR